MNLKTILVLSVMMMGASTFATERTANLIIVNHSNLTMACAKITINEQDHSTITQNWYVINNGATLNVGEATFFYCEEMGNPNTQWAGNEQFCVSGPRKYINPIYRSNNTRVCREADGDMRGFLDIPSTAKHSYTFTAT